MVHGLAIALWPRGCPHDWAVKRIVRLKLCLTSTQGVWFNNNISRLFRMFLFPFVKSFIERVLEILEFLLIHSQNSFHARTFSFLILFWAAHGKQMQVRKWFDYFFPFLLVIPDKQFLAKILMNSYWNDWWKWSVSVRNFLFYIKLYSNLA